MRELDLSTIKSLSTSTCKLDLKSNNIIYIHTFEDAVIEIPEIDELNKMMRTLVADEPCFLLVFPGAGSVSSAEARKYAAKLKGKNIMAEAIILNNLPLRLLANFYMKVNRPKQKIKLFENEASAMEWIKTIIEKGF